MASLPSDAEVRSRAESLGLIAAGADLDNRTRARVARILQDEAQAPTASSPRLLSSVRYPVDGGEIRVDVTFHPSPKGSTPT